MEFFLLLIMFVHTVSPCVKGPNNVLSSFDLHVHAHPTYICYCFKNHLHTTNNILESHSG